MRSKILLKCCSCEAHKDNGAHTLGKVPTNSKRLVESSYEENKEQLLSYLFLLIGCRFTHVQYFNAPYGNLKISIGFVLPLRDHYCDLTISWKEKPSDLSKTKQCLLFSYPSWVLFQFFLTLIYTTCRYPSRVI